MDKKLPIFDVIDSPEIECLDFSNPAILKKFQQRYLWGQFLCWNYEDSAPKGCIAGTFRREYKTPEVEGEVLLHSLEISQKKSTLMYPKYINKKEEYLPVRSHREFSDMVFTIDPENAIDI